MHGRGCEPPPLKDTCSLLCLSPISRLSAFVALLAAEAPCMTQSVVPFPHGPHRSCPQAPPRVPGMVLPVPTDDSLSPKVPALVPPSYSGPQCFPIFLLQMRLWSPGWGGVCGRGCHSPPPRASGQNGLSRVFACMYRLPCCPRKGFPCTPLDSPGKAAPHCDPRRLHSRVE